MVALLDKIGECAYLASKRLRDWIDHTYKSTQIAHSRKSNHQSVLYYEYDGARKKENDG